MNKFNCVGKFVNMNEELLLRAICKWNGTERIENAEVKKDT
jgi:hypothetical protein